MSRSERLLNLLQVLRRRRRPVSAQALADELAVSLRTLYRDIASLRAQGAEHHSLLLLCDPDGSPVNVFSRPKAEAAVSDV